MDELLDLHRKLDQLRRGVDELVVAVERVDGRLDVIQHCLRACLGVALSLVIAVVAIVLMLALVVPGRG